MGKVISFLRVNETIPRVIAVMGLVTMLLVSPFYDGLLVHHIGMGLCLLSFLIVYWQVLTSWKCELDNKEADSGMDKR